MTKDEVLKLALEAFGEIEWSNNSQWQSDRAKVAITAIKEALANEALEKMAENARELGLDYEPAQEPVAWITEWEGQYSSGKILDYIAHTRGGKVEYTPLYTTPPQRKPLTEDEILSISADCASSHQHMDIHFARAIEAKLKAKNT